MTYNEDFGDGGAAQLVTAALHRSEAFRCSA